MKNYLACLMLNELCKVTHNLRDFAIKRLQKYFEVIDAEDAAVANLAALAGGKYLYVSPASVETVSQRDAVTEFEDRAVGFPYGNIDRVAGV